jgi:predicted O-methyltransferase YrrM
MEWCVQAPGFSLQYLVDTFPWPDEEVEVGEGKFTVVDVGGGLGHVSRALATHSPRNAQFIVQDTENVVVQGEAALSPDDDLNGRVRFQSHDFLEKQPVHGASVYLLRLILHDWSDKYASMILKALVPALRPGAKVVINDRVVPGHREVHYLAEREKR